MTTPRHLLPLLGHLAALAALVALAGLRLVGPDMHRPFETDELLTVRHYTWVGVQPSGEQRLLPHIEDFYAVGPPTPAELAMGVYCGAGRWPEPNNHVVNSLLVSAALAAGERSERCARAPALLGGLAFAAAVYLLCSAVLHWRYAAPLAAAWAWFLPYTATYSQTARGFTWMMALQVALLLLAYLLARRPTSLALAALTAAAAALSLVNVVSMAADWLLPFFLALYFVRPAAPGLPAPPEAPPDDRAWRRTVLALALAVAAVGGVFFLSHLPALYSSARQNGLPFRSPAQFFELALGMFTDLFPDLPARAFALAGTAGLAALAFDRRHRFLGALLAALVAVNLLHFLLARHFPPSRAAGHVIPFVVLGAAYLAERAVRAFETAPARAAMLAALALVTLGQVAIHQEQSLENTSLTRCLELARRMKVPPGSRVHLPISSGVQHLVAAYAPREWHQVDAVRPADRLTVVLFELDTQPSPEGLEFLRLPRYQLRRLSGEARPLPPEGPAPPGSLVFWYPDFLALGLNGRPQEELARASGLPFLTTFTRHQIKFDVYSHPQAFVFLPTAGDDSWPARAAEAAREAARRLGGRAVVFVPTETQLLR